jgi:hypothetical protein
MKRNVLNAGMLLLLSITVLAGCGSSGQKAAPAEAEKVQYQCPMKCTEEFFDKSGKCPVCEMDLEKVTKS